LCQIFRKELSKCLKRFGDSDTLPQFNDCQAILASDYLATSLISGGHLLCRNVEIGLWRRHALKEKWSVALNRFN
jgi:hypothetical protein